MEGNKLDLSGKKEDKQPLASYKAIPEADMEEETVTSPKAVIKVKNYSGTDGADEKMLSDDESKFNSHNVDIPDDKVIFKEKMEMQNWILKLDLHSLEWVRKN
ncbi:hypothetical protein HHI36_002959 [Cryptolaemus montrouzieri]|uniref:Uncharacterized protein n=1 Tax=Cryptolaemus montrouzieri TaxID=559131 RepID=A0ABD2PCM8_9CUCU